MIILTILLTAVLLTGCSSTAAGTANDTAEVKTIEVKPIEIKETVLTENILYEETLYEENGTFSAKDLKHDMCENNIYFTDDNGDGIIRIWGKEEYYTQDKYMAYVYYDIESYEIENIVIVHDYISKKVYELLENYYIGEFWYEF